MTSSVNLLGVVECAETIAIAVCGMPITASSTTWRQREGVVRPSGKFNPSHHDFPRWGAAGILCDVVCLAIHDMASRLIPAARSDDRFGWFGDGPLPSRDGLDRTFGSGQVWPRNDRYGMSNRV